MRNLIPISALSALLAVAALAQPPKAPPNAIRLSKYILTVSNIERSFAFYRDALGVQLDGATELQKPQVGAAANQITGAPDSSSFRNTNMKLAGADFVFEFIEFTGLDRTPRLPRIQDPGASVLVLTVRDVDAALTRLKNAGAKVVTTGGAPIHNPVAQIRAVLMTDPDGYFVELQQPDSLPATSVMEGNLVIGARFSTTVADAEKTAQFYRDRFGFEIMLVDWDGSEAQMKTTGTPGAQLRRYRMKVPGSTLLWTLLEFKGIDRTPAHINVPDPGSLKLGFQVRDIDAAAANFKAVGGAIMSRGGEIIRRPTGASVALIRDPDGRYLEVSQPAPPTQQK